MRRWGPLSDDARARVAAALPAYSIEAPLGAGAFGVVWAGVHHPVGRRVAVKQLTSPTPDLRRRFLAEAKVLAALGHPHVVPLYDYIEDDDLCLLVMERLDGGNLGERRVLKGPLDVGASCAVIMATCAALDHAHKHGVLHRDIKPQNLMFSSEDVLKVADFGIAKVVAEGVATLTTTVDQIKGTPAYMAPEQIAGGVLGPGVDVYATGVVLYELLTGVRPFSDEGGAMSIAYRHVNDEPIPMDTAAPDLRGPLSDVTMRALSHATRDRYASAEELGVAVGAAATAVLGSDWLDKSTIQVQAAGRILDAARRTPARQRDPGRRRDPDPALPAGPQAADDDPTVGVGTSMPTGAVPALTTAAPSRRTGRVGALLGVGAFVILIAVGALVLLQPGAAQHKPPPPPPPGPTTTTTTTPPGACSLGKNTAIPTVPCHTSVFSPAFTMNVSAGWRSVDGETADGIDMTRGDPNAELLTIIRVTRVFTPGGNGATEAAPADLVAWLESNPQLQVTSPSKVTIGGIAGTLVNVTVVGPQTERCGTTPCVDVFRLETKPPDVALTNQDSSNQLTILPLGTYNVVIVTTAPPAQFPAFAAEADQILATMHFVGSPA